MFFFFTCSVYKVCHDSDNRELVEVVYSPVGERYVEYNPVGERYVVKNPVGERNAEYDPVGEK